MIEKAHKYDNSLEFFKEKEKHTKGYIYGSLCYRYQLARYKAMNEDIENYINSKGYTKKKLKMQLENSMKEIVCAFIKFLMRQLENMTNVDLLERTM